MKETNIEPVSERDTAMASLLQAQDYAGRFGIPAYPLSEEIAINQMHELARHYWQEVRLLIN